MTARAVERTRARHEIHIRGKDLAACLIVMSTIQVYAFNLILPPHFEAAVAMVGLLFLCIYYLYGKKSPDSCSVLWGIYMIWLCASNLYNGRSLANAIFYPARVILFLLIHKLYLDRRDATLLKFTRRYLTLLIAITFAIQLVDQDAFGYTSAHNYINFFESDNFLGWYYAPYICLCVLLDFIERDRIRPVTCCEIALCAASIARAWVGKTLVALAGIILYLLLVYRRRIAKFFRSALLWIGFAVINVGVVFFGMQRLVSASLYDLLGKDVTLGNRTFIWASAIQNFLRHPIIGHGVAQSGDLPINRGLGGMQVPAHNLFLEVAVQAGAPGLVCYVAMLLAAFATGYRKYRRDIRCRQCRYEYLLIHFFILIMFVMAILSYPVYIPFFYLPLILLASFDSLVDMRDMRAGKGRYDGQ